MSTANTMILGAGAGASLLALAGTLTWRGGIEFERAWLRALAAPPEQWEQELFARELAAIERRRRNTESAGRAKRSAPAATDVREAVPA